MIQYNGKNYISITRLWPDQYDVIVMVPNTDALGGISMKFIHLSDLHLGKRVNEFSMLEDQQYILTEILHIIDTEKPDGVLIAGDVYDKSVPSAEAVALLDDFLVRMSKRSLRIFLISSSHDSPERMAFGDRLMENSGVYLAPVYDGKVTPIIATIMQNQMWSLDSRMVIML